ncbi:MAG: hypothetical protein JWQ23_2457 [Herminiimonas sp.]|nr:hypothetical protein [Herminiimonas sp.]
MSLSNLVTLTGAPASNRHRFSRLLPAFIVLAGAASIACGQARFEEDFDDADKSWQEVALQLPPAPLPENLLPVYISATATQSFAIDARSLTVGADGVIRFTLVATSPAGAKNVSYEGIRCASFEKKLYAVGHSEGRWSRSRRDQWEPIVRNAANRQHATLAQDYFCESKSVAGNAETMLARIREDRPINSRTDGGR